MSRIGKQPIPIPDGVEVKIEQGKVKSKGKAGSLEFDVPRGIVVQEAEGKLVVTREGDDKRARSLHGLVRSVLKNQVQGVKAGYSKELDIVGVSYQASLSGKKLTLKVGLANELVFTVPEGLTVEVPRPTAVIIKGADKQMVGQFAAEIRSSRPPEPYKGKGVRYAGERVVRKQGKSFVGSE